MKKAMKLVLAASALAATMGASANSLFTGPGAYLLLDGTHSRDRDAGGLSVSGVGIRGGYSFGSGVAVEAGYDYLGKDFGVRFSAVTGGLVYTYGLTEGAALRVSAGAARLKASGAATGSTTDPYFGLGAEFAILRNATLLTEYRRFAGDARVDNYSLGLKVRF